MTTPCYKAQLKETHKTWAKPLKTVIATNQFASVLLTWWAWPRFLACLIRMLIVSSLPSRLHSLDCQGHFTEFFYFDLLRRAEGWSWWTLKQRTQTSVLPWPYSCWMSSIWLSWQPCQMVNCDETYVPPGLHGQLICSEGTLVNAENLK